MDGEGSTGQWRRWNSNLEFSPKNSPLRNLPTVSYKVFTENSFTVTGRKCKDGKGIDNHAKFVTPLKDETVEKQKREIIKTKFE